MAVPAQRLAISLKAKKAEGECIVSFDLNYDGETLSSVSGVKKDDMLSIYVRDGLVKAQVTDVEELSYE